MEQLELARDENQGNHQLNGIKKSCKEKAFTFSGMVVNSNVDMVEQVESRGLVVTLRNYACIFFVAFLCDVAAHWEARCAKSVLSFCIVAPSNRHVVFK